MHVDIGFKGLRHSLFNDSVFSNFVSLELYGYCKEKYLHVCHS